MGVGMENWNMRQRGKGIRIMQREEKDVVVKYRLEIDFDRIFGFERSENRLAVKQLASTE